VANLECRIADCSTSCRNRLYDNAACAHDRIVGDGGHNHSAIANPDIPPQAYLLELCGLGSAVFAGGGMLSTTTKHVDIAAQ
jgi:hypothetical protein